MSESNTTGIISIYLLKNRFGGISGKEQDQFSYRYQ